MQSVSFYSNSFYKGGIGHGLSTILTSELKLHDSGQVRHFPKGIDFVGISYVNMGIKETSYSRSPGWILVMG